MQNEMLVGNKPMNEYFPTPSNVSIMVLKHTFPPSEQRNVFTPNVPESANGHTDEDERL